MQKIFVNHIHPIILVFIGIHVVLQMLVLSDEYPCDRVSVIFQLFCMIVF